MRNKSVSSKSSAGGKGVYSAPQISSIEVQSEQGFAWSNKIPPLEPDDFFSFGWGDDDCDDEVY